MLELPSPIIYSEFYPNHLKVSEYWAKYWATEKNKTMSELDELEREEFFRLKRSQDKKRKDIAAKKVAAAEALADSSVMTTGGAKDPDMIF